MKLLLRGESERRGRRRRWREEAEEVGGVVKGEGL